MKLTPQQFQLVEMHEDGKWHCSTEVEYMRDARKRYSELVRMGYVFEKEKCAQYGHSHNSGLLMRRLVKMPPDALQAPQTFSGNTGTGFFTQCPEGQIEASTLKNSHQSGILQAQMTF